MNPIDFKPNKPQDFIGPARAVAAILERIVERSRATGAPIKLFLQGNAGVGKSSLLDYFLGRLGVSKWAVTKLSGTKVRIEDVDDWASRLCYLELGGGYKVLRIEEMDRASHTARARLLMCLDDLPRHVAVVCTSNKEQGTVEPRFLSRFQNITVDAPPAADIKRLLQRFGLTPGKTGFISEIACGNVRLALNEAQTALDEMAARRCVV